MLRVLIVVDDLLGAIVTIDPSSGDRRIFPGQGTGNGPAFSFPGGIDQRVNGDFVVIDPDLGAIFKVDRQTGDRTVISDASLGSGPDLSFVENIVVEPSGAFVVAGLNSQSSIYRIDQVTGGCTVVSSNSTGSGPRLGTPSDLHFAPSGQLIVGAGASLLLVDVVSGDRELIPSDDSGAGFLVPALAVEPDGDIVVADRLAGTILRVDSSSGETTVVSGPGVGTGPELLQLSGVVVEASGDFLVLDSRIDGVFRVQASTGNRTAVSLGPCPEFSGTRACYRDGRFEASVELRDFDGNSGFGNPVSITDGSGFFWFFDPDVADVFINVLDACNLEDFNSYWVFVVGLTNVEVSVTVRDTMTGESRSYFNPTGEAFQPIQDTTAFTGCP